MALLTPKRGSIYREIPGSLMVQHLVAPGDLAMSMGVSPITYEWQSGERPKELEQAVDRAIKTIVDAGKVCGTLVSRGDVQSFIQKGVRLVYDHANHMLARGSREFLNLVRMAPPKISGSR